MFGRKSNSVAATPSKVTVIAAGACFRGDLQVEGDLEVHGQLIGSIQLIDGVLRIMQGRSVEGEVNAPDVTINGLLDGTCSTAEVEILENGKMQGIFKGGLHLQGRAFYRSFPPSRGCGDRNGPCRGIG